MSRETNADGICSVICIDSSLDSPLFNAKPFEIIGIILKHCRNEFIKIHRIQVGMVRQGD